APRLQMFQLIIYRARPYYPHPRLLEQTGRARRRILGHHDHRPHPRGSNERRVERGAGETVEHDADRWYARRRRVSHGEHGVVGQHGAYAYRDRVAARAQLVRRRARSAPRDPLGTARRVGDGAVDRQRELERDPRTRRTERMKERRVGLERSALLDAAYDL